MEKTFHRYTPEEWIAVRPDKKHLASYITYKPNMLSIELCDQLVSIYDQNPSLHTIKTQGADHFRFSQLNLTAACDQPIIAAAHQLVVKQIVPAIKQYHIDVDALDADTRLPTRYGFEEIRINRTENNGRDGFGLHTDVGDYASARRFITALFYLRDNEIGGDAAFPELGISFKPTKGAMLIFPSTWQYLHCGYKPIDQPKYIMTTFCHYV